MIDLTSISTYGWFSDEKFRNDLLGSIGIYGWVELTVQDLVNFFQVADFNLVIKSLQELGLEIKTTEEFDSLDIATMLSKSLIITTQKSFTLTR